MLCRLLNSCKPGVLMLPFMLVQTRSFVPCSLDLCWRGEFVIAFYARANKERWCHVQFRLMQARSFVSCSLGSCGQGALWFVKRSGRVVPRNLHSKEP
ncbi:hypothetical protein ACFX1T_043222 [Malus domestica]